MLTMRRGDARRQTLDMARDEGAVDEIAQQRVLGRRELEQRMTLDLEERRDMAGRLGRLAALQRRREGAFRRRISHHQQPHGADGGAGVVGK
ncbi:hypothetical protein B4Q13_16920 [Lacticaseibacillus rhamnosus]